MQKRLWLTGLFLLLSALLLTGVASADHLQTRFRANLTGGQEVPPVNTDAHGEAHFRLNQRGDALHYVVKVRDIDDASAAHIHMAPPGENGPVIVTLCGGPGAAPACTAPSDGGLLVEGVITETLSGEPLYVLLDALRSGNTYVNVHSPASPSGEVRGQIH